MNILFFDAAISLDGYFAGDNRGPENPLGDGGMSLHTWMYEQKAFFRSLGMEGGKEDGAESALIDATLARTGAYIMGKKMFDEGEVNWPNDLYKRDVYVLSHEKRNPWVQEGSTVFYFVNDGIESALAQARKSAGGKDVRIQGGADVIQQFLNVGLVNEFLLHITPVILGSGIRLFDSIDKTINHFEVAELIPAALTTHIRYRVTRK